jgi:P-type E1-E2 ATPase
MALNEINMAENVVSCLRDGVRTTVNIDNIKVGDLVYLKAGMSIPVDGVVIYGSGIETNEAPMTGESEDRKKEPLEVCL